MQWQHGWVLTALAGCAVATAGLMAGSCIKTTCRQQDSIHCNSTGDTSSNGMSRAFCTPCNLHRLPGLERSQSHTQLRLCSASHGHVVWHAKPMCIGQHLWYWR